MKPRLLWKKWSKVWKSIGKPEEKKLDIVPAEAEPSTTSPVANPNDDTLDGQTKLERSIDKIHEHSETKSESQNHIYQSPWSSFYSTSTSTASTSLPDVSNSSFLQSHPLLVLKELVKNNSIIINNNNNTKQISVRDMTGQAWSHVENATYSWLHKYVITTSPNNDGDGGDGSWQFRTLFVAEVSTLPFLLMFVFITAWLLNRNTHIKKTKGSTISRHRADWTDNDDIDDDDDDDQDPNLEMNNDNDDSERSDENNGNTQRLRRQSQIRHSSESRVRTRQAKRRLTIQAKLQAYDIERDDDHTLVTVDGLEDSDYEDDIGLSPPQQLGRHDEQTFSSMSNSKWFLPKEKREIWKTVKGQIPVFSYFNQAAMQICMEGAEYVDLKRKGDTLWRSGGFDGSLYYVMKGSVAVNFHNFKPADSELSGSELIDNNHEVLIWPHPPDNNRRLSTSVTHEAGTVVTSMLALCEGMVQAHLRKFSPLARHVGKALADTSARATEDDTRLLRVPPTCFSVILERFPETALRVIQTVLNRTQRITVQILVRTCGLRRELLRPPTKDLIAALAPKKDKSNSWGWITSFLEKRIHSPSDLESLSDDERCALTLNACRVLVSILGIKEQASVDVLQEQCSVISIPTAQNDGQPTVLLEAGTSQDACFLLLKGNIELGMLAPVPGSSFAELQSDPSRWSFQCFERVSPGGLLGEDASFTTDVHLFEARCSSPTIGKTDNAAVLLRVPREVFSWLITKHPAAMSISMGKMLCAIGPLIHLLSWMSEIFHIEAAKAIVKKGRKCESIFVVLNGRLRASNRSAPSKHTLKESTLNSLPPEEYGRGKIIGEVGALAGKPWPFDVFAIRQSELAKVPVRILEVVAQNYPSAGIFLARSVASHVESLYSVRNRDSSKKPIQRSADAPRGLSMNSNIGASPSLSHTPPNTLPSYGLSLATIAVVPLTFNVDMKKFCLTLSTAMRAIAPTKLLTKSYMRQELGEKVYTARNALNDLRITRFLADLEENNRVVVYQADHKYTFWTRLCVQQADAILLVVDASHAPEQNRIEQTLAWVYESMDVRIDLVVVGDPKSDNQIEEEYDDVFMDDDEMTVSDQLNNWSESRAWISGHHLVRKPFDRYLNDFRRMTRRITGRSVGLVLGGGGARGIAHVGVIRALIEAGVSVDLVGGTSQGAFCGALFAQNPDSYIEVEKSTRAMAAQMASIKAKVFDLTLPLSSIFTGRSFNRGIRKLLGKMRIQDLVLNFFCVSVDLQKQAAVVHTKGLLWKYVRASMTLAGYLPPVAEDNSLLVDGGYMNTCPADVMKFKMGARTVISVDVSPESQRSYEMYGTHLSGWWLLWNSWNPFVTTVQVPSMGDISELLIWVSSEKHRKSVAAVSDLHLTPPVEDFGTLEYDKFDTILDVGYEYAKPIVDEWVRQNPWLVSSDKRNLSQSKTPSREVSVG